ncbi:MAG: nucleotide pyrophosphohydrolase [Chloroflexota bacterium]
MENTKNLRSSPFIPGLINAQESAKVKSRKVVFTQLLRARRMDIKELTERMHAFVASKGWYEKDSPRPQTPRNLAISLALEAAEILEHFQWRDETKDKDELASELADVALYLLQLASISGIDLEQAILNKLETNASRQWDKDTSNVESRKSGDV